MLTYKTLQDRALKNFDDVTYRPLVKDFLNEALGLLHRRFDFPADDATVTLNTVAGVTTYAFPGTAPERVQGVSIPALQTGYLRELDEGSEADYTTADTGAPDHWGVQGGQLVLRPTPDAVYAVAIDLQPTVTRMSADTDVPNLPEDYHDLLRVYAVSKCYSEEEDFEAAGARMQEFEAGALRLAADVQNLTTDDTPQQVPGSWGLDGYVG